MAGALVGTLVSLAVGAGAAWLFTRDDGIGEQVDEVRATLQEDGFEVRYRELRLHQGGPSHLFVASRSGRSVPAAARRSDEVRIYDVVDGSLELELAFRPEVAVSPAPAGPAAAAFQLRSVSDIDGDGQDEILGSYETNLAGVEYQRIPVLVARESRSARYVVTPLLSPAKLGGQVTAGLSTFRFGEAGGRLAPTVWVADFELDTGSFFSDRRSTLVTRVIAGGDPQGSDLTVEVVPRRAGTAPAVPRQIRFWTVELEGPAPRVTALCLFAGGGPGRPLRVPAPPADTEALLGKPLADAMTAGGLGLGDYVDGRCHEPAA